MAALCLSCLIDWSLSCRFSWDETPLHEVSQRSGSSFSPELLMFRADEHDGSSHLNFLVQLPQPKMPCFDAADEQDHRDRVHEACAAKSLRQYITHISLK
ncbi:hypothetical protein F5Y15DRAFT_370220 [Xylariaceae sp. FL0016]|nr:hypothetical protein F5Y15DRAFT_370220 [Xylariaceae sp. FL0016]